MKKPSVRPDGVLRSWDSWDSWDSSSEAPAVFALAQSRKDDGKLPAVEKKP